MKTDELLPEETFKSLSIEKEHLYEIIRQYLADNDGMFLVLMETPKSVLIEFRFMTNETMQGLANVVCKYADRTPESGQRITRKGPHNEIMHIAMVWNPTIEKSKLTTREQGKT